MSETDNNAHTQRAKIMTLVIVALALGILLAVVLIYTCAISHPVSPMEKLAKKLYRIEDDALYWDYEAMFDAYNECRDSMHRNQLLDLMLKSRASHLVPRIIDSIRPGGSWDAETKIQAITELTGKDFSEEFDIKHIWKREVAEQTKLLLHQWWNQNGKEVIQSKGPKNKFNIPNHWPSLALDLKTEKTQYLQLEPIRITTMVRNNSDTWFTFPYKLRKPAFRIEYFIVLDDKNSVSLAKTPYPERWIFCGNAERWFPKPSFLTLDSDSCHVVQQWLNHIYFEAGDLSLRAVLTPLLGEHKGKRLTSNVLELNIQEPQGPDAAAYKYITPRGTVDVGNGHKFGPGFMYGGLVLNSSSLHGRPVHEFFLKDYSDSVYANYVRYTLAIDAMYPQRQDVLYKYMSDITDNCPRDFPLLSDAYANLLEYYKKRGELDKMAALSKTIDLGALNIVDPRLSERLSDLMNHAEWVASRVHFKDNFGKTSLHYAAEKGPPALVKFLIDNGAKVNEKEEYGYTPLHQAAKEGHKEIVKILIVSGADVNIQGERGRPPLFWPIVNGNKEIVQILLNSGAKVNSQDSSRRTPFNWAIRNNREEIAGLLINTKGENGWTPLHWAVHNAKTSMVRLLLKRGARVDIKDDQGKTPVDIAQECAEQSPNHKPVVVVLRDYGVID
jgi:hypothetical protein